MARKLPDLSKGEWLVMNLCWKRGRATARQIFDESPPQRTWSYPTVKTMLDRLAVKGYLRREKLGPLCLFEPLVPRERVVRRSLDMIWDTVLGRTLAPLFAHLTPASLSDDEIASLKKLLQEHDGKAKQRKGAR